MHVCGVHFTFTQVMQGYPYKAEARRVDRPISAWPIVCLVTRGDLCSGAIYESLCPGGDGVQYLIRLYIQCVEARACGARRSAAGDTVNAKSNVLLSVL